MHTTSILIGFLCVLFFAGLAHLVFSVITVKLDDESETFILSMGKVKKILVEPGLHFVPQKILPWVQIINISKQIDFRTFKNIQVSDHYGTTVNIDLWIEFKISNPYKAFFSVENWEEVLKSLILSNVAAILSTQTVSSIIKQRNELADQLRESVSSETERWGLTVSSAMIQNVGLLTETSKKLFNTVAAKIERTKALIEEEGRLKVAKLDADTYHKVAELNGLAKAQHSIAIGTAYSKLSSDPRLLRAFQDYWSMLHLDPRKTVTFSGLKTSSIDAVESTAAIESIVSH
jgi:regulator of protease activity HflC (stomatin/prohibitin superfamily)